MGDLLQPCEAEKTATSFNGVDRAEDAGQQVLGVEIDSRLTSS